MPHAISRPDLSTGFHGWTDARVIAEWRLQWHATKNRWRVLRSNDTIAFSGTEKEARSYFDESCRRYDLAWNGRHYVVLLHGLARTGRCMRRLARAVSRAGEATPVRFFYSTTRHSIDSHAHALDAVLAELPAGSTVDFVGHSLGGIVLRRWFALHSTVQQSMHLGRMVMLGPPNQGSRLASVLYRSGTFRHWFGAPGGQLGMQWPQFAGALAEPPLECGIIAGRVPLAVACNPVLGRNNDWIVSVEETHLESAKEQVVVPVPHFFLMAAPRTIRLTMRFLQTGSFRGGD